MIKFSGALNFCRHIKLSSLYRELYSAEESELDCDSDIATKQLHSHCRSVNVAHQSEVRWFDSSFPGSLVKASLSKALKPMLPKKQSIYHLHWTDHLLHR